MNEFSEIVAKRDILVNEEITNHVIKNLPYKGWVSSYLGDGALVFTKSGESDIKAYRGREVEDWILETWMECKVRIDKFEIKKYTSISGRDKFTENRSLKKSK